MSGTNERPPCPQCHAVNTEIFTTVSQNDPLYFCRVCVLFWRPREDAPTAPPDSDPSPDDGNGNA
jgi:late competence protein required for DNA uptake (superfamily II DNA/RNA helicase)